MHKNNVLFGDDEINVISAIRRAVMEEPCSFFHRQRPRSP